MNMRMSDAGTYLIRKKESLRLDAYPDPGSKDGLPITIGWGSTKRMDGSPWKLGDTVTAAEAEELFRRDISDAERSVNNVVTVPLTQPQFDALVSLTFNIGGGAFAKSTLLRLLNKGDFANAAKQFDRWVYNDGKVMNGLITRRAHERAMFEMAAPIVVQAPGSPEVQGMKPAPIEESVPTIVNPKPGPTPDTPKVDHVELVSSLWQALRAGSKLANAVTWKKRQNAVNAITAILVAGIGLAKVFGHEFNVDEEVLAGVGAGVWAVVSLFNNWATTATTADTGLPPRTGSH